MKIAPVFVEDRLHFGKAQNKFGIALDLRYLWLRPKYFVPYMEI